MTHLPELALRARRRKNLRAPARAQAAVRRRNSQEPTYPRPHKIAWSGPNVLAHHSKLLRARLSIGGETWLPANLFGQVASMTSDQRLCLAGDWSVMMRA